MNAPANAPGAADIAAHLLTLTTYDARVVALENIIASSSPSQAARATYLLAQTQAARGEFDAALKHIASARDQYAALGLTLDALRTSIGRIHVLKELGRYADALSVADDVEKALQATATTTEPEDSARLAIAALAQQNRGVCFEQMGRYDEALAAYQAAEDRFRAANAEDHIGDIINNRGVILLHLGRAAEALRAFEAAAAVFAPTGDAVRQAQTQINMGYAHTQQGDDAKGLAAFEQATRTLTDVQADAEAQIAMLDMAEAYLSLNLHAEASVTYGEVLALTERTGMQHEQARAHWGLGMASAALGQFEQARLAFETAAMLFEAANNTPMLCNVLLQQSALSQRRGNLEEALAQARRVVVLCSWGDWPLQQAEAQLRVAELMLPAVSRSLLAQAQSLVEAVDLPRLHTRLQTLLGRAAFARGRLEQAETHFKAAIQQTEAHRARLNRAQLRAAFTQDKAALYGDLVQVMLTRNAEAKTIFAQVEQAKSRALLDMLAGTHADVERDAGSAAQRNQHTATAALQVQLNMLYTKLLLGPSATNPDEFVRLQIEAIQVERKLSHAQMRTASLSPTQADPIAAPLSLDEIQSCLPDDVALLNFYICQSEVIAFVVSQQSVQLVRQITTEETVRPLLAQLRAEWQRFQLGDAFVHKHMAQMEASVKETLHTLHHALLSSLEPMLQMRKWVIVPHGLLHHIPFQALFDGAAYVIDVHEVSYAPSCTAYALSQTRRAPATARQVVFGNDEVAIPNAATEARAIAQSLAGSTLCLNEAATLAAFQAHAPGCGTLHLACHGLFRADNPMFSALKLRDGWLKAIDVLGLDLTGACVALSACDSGRSEVLGGDELMGLARAFLGAGAASLLVSQWLVRDDATALLMTAWYHHMQRGLGRCAALRDAQLQARTTFNHPYYWAAFVLFGQRE